MSTPTVVEKKAADVVKSAELFALIQLAAKRLYSDQVNGNLATVRQQLELIGGTTACAIVLEMFLMATEEERQFLRKTMNFSADCEFPSYQPRRRKAMRELALLQLCANEQ